MFLVSMQNTAASSVICITKSMTSVTVLSMLHVDFCRVPYTKDLAVCGHAVHADPQHPPPSSLVQVPHVSDHKQPFDGKQKG
jgi:hypothetical protein